MKIETILFVRTCNIKLWSPSGSYENETCRRTDTIYFTWVQFIYVVQIRHKYGKCKNKLGYTSQTNIPSETNRILKKDLWNSNALSHLWTWLDSPSVTHGSHTKRNLTTCYISPQVVTYVKFILLVCFILFHAAVSASWGMLCRMRCADKLWTGLVMSGGAWSSASPKKNMYLIWDAHSGNYEVLCSDYTALYRRR